MTRAGRFPRTTTQSTNEGPKATRPQPSTNASPIHKRREKDVSNVMGCVWTPPPGFGFHVACPEMTVGFFFFFYVKQHVVGALCRSLAWLAAAVCVCVTKTGVVSLAERGSSI